jgi:predicted MFS family arabinose efflux permease
VIAAQSGSPTLLALVQTCSTAPAVAFALVAGAAADMVDRRRLLVALTAAMAAVMAALALLVAADAASPAAVLLLTLALGAAIAMAVPAFASFIPDLVPREDLAGAVTLNGISINLARAVGPALAGGVVALAGAGVLFAAEAAVLTGLVIVLAMLRSAPERPPSRGERLRDVMRAGVSFARQSQELRAVLGRGGSFVVPASAMWALLPVVAVDSLDLGSAGFGVLLGALGAGAVTGAQVLPTLRQRLGLNRLTVAGSVYVAVTLALLTLVGSELVAAMAMFFAGAAWITVLSSLQTAAQLAAPDWVRGRALAVNQLVFAGGMAGGSVLWGVVAEVWGLDQALLGAALTLVVSAVAARRWRLGALPGAEEPDRRG